MPRQKY